MKQAELSVLGFYREHPGPAEMTSRVYADSQGLYLHLPSHLRNRLEVVVGNRIEGRIEQIETGGGECMSVQHDVTFEVEGYWHEMRLPAAVAERFDLRCGDVIHLTLMRISRFGEVSKI